MERKGSKSPILGALLSGSSGAAAPPRTLSGGLHRTLSGGSGPACKLPAEGKENLEAPTVCGELKIIATNGLLLGFSHGSRILQELSTSIMLGRSNTRFLAAVMLSCVWADVLNGFWRASIGQLSALAGQAHGAGNLQMVGVWLQIFVVYGTLVILPVLGLRLCTSQVLQAVGINAELAADAETYIVWSSPSIFTELWYFSLQSWYASRLIILPDAITDAIFILVRIGVNYVFIFVLDWGLQGAAIALVIVNACRLIFYVLFTWLAGYSEGVWKGVQCKEIWVRQRWRIALGMILPAMVGGLLEEANFQVSSVFAGQFSDVEAAALQLIINIVLFGFIVSFAGGDVIGIQMAKYLGAGRPWQARFVTRIGLAAYSVGSAVMGLIIALAMPLIAKGVTTDPTVRQRLVSVRWTLGVGLCTISVFIVLANVLTKQGRAHVLMIVVPVSCWFAGLPASYFLSHVPEEEWNWLYGGAVGIFNGLGFGYIIAAMGTLVAWHWSDWKALSEQAQHASETVVAPAWEDLAISLQPAQEDSSA